VTEVAPPTYRALDEAKIIGTFERLRNRIGERFPEAGLREVAEELNVQRLREPIYFVRGTRRTSAR
jgi:hypothetical protein